MLAAVKSDNPEVPINEKKGFSKQLEDFKSSIDLIRSLMTEMESAYKRAESLLRDELKKKEEMLQLRDSAARELKENLSAKIWNLASQLSEKEELLKSRDGQLERLRSEVNALTARLAEMESAKDRAECFLQNELKRKEEILQVKGSAIRIIELTEIV